MNKIAVMKIYQVRKIPPRSPDNIPWNSAIVLNDFSYPWSSEMAPATSFRALWDEVFLYFRFDAQDYKIHVNPIKANKQEINYFDRVEMFFTTGDKLNPYYCLEMDPLGQVMDFEAHHPKRFNFNWKWPDLLLDAQILNNGYTVSGRIAIKTLKSLNLLKNNTLRIGLFRANCIVPGDLNQGFKWISWVDPKTRYPDFHLIESLGKFKFNASF